MALICHCHIRAIHGGRFQRCRKHAVCQIRVADTRTIADLKRGQTEPMAGIWFDYCEACAKTIQTQRDDLERREL